jgi:hypothetical protein
MSREEPKITITKEGALQITDKDECHRYLNTVRDAIERAKKIVARRNSEVERLRGIEENLSSRYNFLSISGKVEPGTWYEQKSSSDQKTFAFVLTYDDIRHSLTTWKFAPESKQISNNWRGEHVFLHPQTAELITSPPKEKNYIVCEARYQVSHQDFSLKGDRSFLMNWIPSSDLSVMMCDPSILEIKSTLEGMHKEDCPTFQRKLRLGGEDEGTRSNVHVVKHNGQWWLLCSLE